ncbi:MAG TPA: PAS domain S-box protein [Rectinemataceae bacterium]|nr:PAS domain S-box protein [Rectinemataceae bacterium]
MQLDIRTILVLLVLGDLAAIAIMLAYVRKASGETPTAFFLLGKAFQAIAWTLLGLRDSLPDLLSVIVGNGLLFAGFAAEVLAIGTVNGRDRRQERAYALIVLIGIACLMPVLAFPNFRVTMASLVTVAIYGWFSTVLVGQMKGSPIRAVMAVATILYAIALASRAVLAAMQSSFSLFSTHFVQYLAFLPQYVILILGTVGFILLLKERDDVLLRESEEKYRSVTEQASEAIVIIQDGKYVFANRRAAEMIGEKAGEEMINREMGFRIHEDDRARIKEGLRSRLAGKETSPADDFRVIGPDGKPFWVSSSSSLISYRGRPANLAVISDIDERKRQQERIEKLLAEKELLLREVNHRVKNNLGVAISLLSLHAEAAEGRPTRDVIAEAQAMLATMSELYESLHRAGSTGTLSIRDYLPSLVDEVARLFPMDPPVRFDLDLEDIRLDARVLSPLGIILNEIMTNSLRHAFAGIASPAIRISACLRDSQVSLECADNGKGLPPGFDPADSQGFGSTLILALAAQLGATWRIEGGNPGTTWHMEFPFDAARR